MKNILLVSALLFTTAYSCPVGCGKDSCGRCYCPDSLGHTLKVSKPMGCAVGCYRNACGQCYCTDDAIRDGCPYGCWKGAIGCECPDPNMDAMEPVGCPYGCWLANGKCECWEQNNDSALGCHKGCTRVNNYCKCPIQEEPVGCPYDCWKNSQGFCQCQDEQDTQFLI